MQPLMVTGPGRSGLHDLHADAGRASRDRGGRRSTQEPRVVTYWIEVLRALARPDSFMRQVAPARAPERRLVARAGATRARAARRSETCRRGSREQAVEDLAAFAQSRIEAVYTRVGPPEADDRRALLRGEAAQRHRVRPGVGAVPRGARGRARARPARRAVLGAGRNAKRGERPPPADPQRWIGEVFAGRITRSRRAGAAARPRAPGALRGSDAATRGRRSPACSSTSASTPARRRWTRCSRAPDVGCRAWREHRTTPDAASSIGRWRRDLDPACSRSASAVAPALEAWGYTPEHFSHPAASSTG